MKMKSIRLLGVFGALALSLLLPANVHAADKEILPTDVTTASSGCTLVGVEGTYADGAQAALDRMNEIRKEACEEGVIDPATKKALTPEDYKPLKWSSTIEEAVKIRAAEASINSSHTRTNGKSWSTVKTNKADVCSEVIAMSFSKSMTKAVNQWYEEKEDWVNQTSGAVTGHYTSMINSKNTYVGIATFLNENAQWYNTSCAEFSQDNELDSTINGGKANVIQTIEVKNSDLSDASLSLSNAELEPTDTTTVTASLKANGVKVIPLSFTLSSSDESVAKIDSEEPETVLGVHDGTATITAKITDSLSASAEISVDGHPTEYDEEKSYDSTCTEKGKEVWTCPICGYSEEEEIPALGHLFDAGTVTTEPTCTGKGVKTFKCEHNGCTEEYTEDVDALGHDWNDGEVTTKPTCTEDGVKTYTCKTCGGTRTEVVKALGHSYGAYDREEPTCKKAGYVKYTCRNGCDQDYKEILPKSETHTGTIYVSEKAKEPTCTKAGYTAVERCDFCKEIVTESKTIPALGHEYDEGKITTEPTCTEKGIKTFTCVRGDDSYTEEVPSLGGHKYDDGKVVKEATKTEEGEKVYTCTVCGKQRYYVIDKITDEKKDDQNKNNSNQNNKTNNQTTKKDNTLAVGTQFQYSGHTYKVTANGEVSFVKAKKNVKSLSIPATITANGVTYKVTSIASKAVANNKKIKSVTIGSNVKKISKNAFYKCKNLKKVTLKTTVLTKKTASKASFKSVNKKLTIKAPKSVKKSYKKIFKGYKVN